MKTLLALLLLIAAPLVAQTRPGGGGGAGSGGDTITSPNSTINVGGTINNTTLDINLTKTNTWLHGMTIQNGLTVDQIAVSGDGVWATFPLGSQIFEDPTEGLFLEDDNSGGIESHGGFLNLQNGSSYLNNTDGTNSFVVFQVGAPSANKAGFEAGNGILALIMQTGEIGSVIHTANTIENQIGVVPAVSFVPGVFTPKFAIGDNTISVKGAIAYAPLVNSSTSASVALTADSAQSYTLGANTTFTAPTIYLGEHLALQICQPASGGPFTVTYPAAIVGGQPPPIAASTCIQQAFDSYNGTTLVSEDNQAASLTNTGTQTFSGNIAVPVGSSVGTPIIRDAAGIAAATLSVGRWTFPASAAASLPAFMFTGTPFAGTGTTATPMMLFQPTGTTAATSWSVNGTYWGINAPSSWTGNYIDFKLNGATQFIVSPFGSVNGNHFGTNTNCASAATPAACGAATMGAVAVPAGTNPTLTVNMTGVTANSEITLTPDQSLGTRLSVTCNTTIPTNQVVTARTAGTSFTFEAVGTFTTNPVCYGYQVFN
jgi:hypothetical protein